MGWPPPEMAGLYGLRAHIMCAFLAMTSDSGVT
jgi:hypothetical protein